MTAVSDPIVDIRNLSVTFTGGRKPVRAVDDVTLQVGAGEVVALLGESGSGKSVTLRSLLRLHPKGRATMDGSIRVDGEDVLALGPRALADYRGRKVAMIFQDPGLAMDPVYSVGRQIAETIRRHEGVSWSEAEERALALFRKVSIPAPERRLQAYPNAMSGGMRQRAMIALALSCNPKVLLADEPTTALDATVQIQILLLLRDLQREFGISVIFVTHDIGVAVEVADRIAVMYAGRIVEEGPVGDVIRNPRHPYTRGLLAARVDKAEPGARLTTIPGSPPDLADLPDGCAFRPRCALAEERCGRERPPFVRRSGDRGDACLLAT
ncbi:ABC transporter ATP-binding protein [Prosthecomicrobium sp. N25]|uniref:ABC transporter ATP-binding protein n=1 Tax=Prosthecomicrobium sp. N25 TaxID=3129254 RepID=UPI003077EB97